MAASSDRDIRARISQLRREPETVTLIGSDSSRLLQAHLLYCKLLGLEGILFHTLIRDTIIETGKARFYSTLPPEDRILSTDSVPIPGITLVDLRDHQPPLSQLAGGLGGGSAPGESRDGVAGPDIPETDDPRGHGGGAPVPSGVDRRTDNPDDEARRMPAEESGLPSDAAGVATPTPKGADKG